jgi:hypothetical protein
MKRFIWIFLVISVVAVSCNLPVSTTPTAGGDAVGTHVAETISAGAASTLPVVATAAPQETMAVELPTNTPLPTATPLPTSTPLPTATSLPTLTPTPCDKALFVDDITVPDGEDYLAGASFTKTWRLKNDGSCTWNTSYAIVFDSGDKMGAPNAVAMPYNVPPGSTVDISVSLTAPASPGTYRGNWRLRNDTGTVFGISNSSAGLFWVEIEILPPALPPAAALIYNFVANYCDASWVSGAGALPCPGGTGDAGGFVIRADNPTLQNNSTINRVALETHPQWVDDGVISGRYPGLDVKAGYKFRTTLGCLKGGAGCNYKYQLTYRADGGPLTLLTQGTMKYADAPVELDVDLSFLAGKNVVFSLVAMANGSSGQDWAIWAYPRIVK